MIDSLILQPELVELIRPRGADVESQRAREAIRERLFGGGVPVRVGRFSLRERIGAGGMGLVYSAHDPELDRTVAVKLVRIDRKRALAHRREHLRAEARALARLSHPNVVSIYEVGEVDSILYIAMELVQGPDLRRWLAEPRRLDAVLEMFVGIAAGVAAAHEVGIVHRDLKPENVLIGADGRPRVADFGLAAIQPSAANADSCERPQSQIVTLPDVACLAGTPGYLAPEVIGGDIADTRSAQFAFCVCLWEAVYGVHPFARDTPTATAAAIANCELVEPARSSVPRWLRTALRRGLALKPERRWPSIAALARVLGRDRSRRRVWAALGGALAFGIAGAYVGAPTPSAATTSFAAFGDAMAERADARTPDRDPDHAAALLARGKALVEEHAFDEAIAVLGEALSLALASGADEIAVEAWGTRAQAIATAANGRDPFDGREIMTAIAERRPHAASTASFYANLRAIEALTLSSSRARPRP